MDTVGQYVTHVSGQMNDQRPSRAFTRWGRGLLLDYLNLGLTEIGAYRPEAFAKDEITTLVAGATQTIDASKTLIGLSSNMDGTPILPGDIEMATAFNAYAICPIEPRIINGKANYLVRSFAFDSKNTHKFYVDPPVPKGMTVQVNATVTGDVPQYTLADWDKPVEMESKFDASLIDYMMAKAFELDMESAQSRTNSQGLFKKFYDVMGVKYRVESKYRSGNYLGEVGPNPRAGNS
jgi:hypothetical protein